jgi:uncharacterized damage-inducible protein DinB
MTRDDLRTLFDYHYWARDRMLAAVDRLTPEQFTGSMGGSFASIRDTVAHICLADEIWLSRWRGQSPTAFPAEHSLPDVATIRDRWSGIETSVKALLEEFGDEGLQEYFSYRLLSGTEGRSRYADSMQHVVNHGTYHRGQVTTLLRQVGAAPPASMDLIAFFRQRGH